MKYSLLKTASMPYYSNVLSGHVLCFDKCYHQSRGHSSDIPVVPTKLVFSPHLKVNEYYRGFLSEAQIRIVFF